MGLAESLQIEATFSFKEEGEQREEV